MSIKKNEKNKQTKKRNKTQKTRLKKAFVYAKRTTYYLSCLFFFSYGIYWSYKGTGIYHIPSQVSLRSWGKNCWEINNSFKQTLKIKIKLTVLIYEIITCKVNI
jgi:hypothetical protein